MHLIHKLGAGGAENGIINIVNHINQTLFESSICSFAGKGNHTERIDRNYTTLFEFDKKTGNDFRVPLKLFNLYRKWNPDIVHTHTWGTVCEGLIAAKLARVPVIIHGEHGTIQQQKRNIYVQRYLWDMADQVLSVSNTHRDRLSKTIGYPKSKIKVIMNGVDTERFQVDGQNKSVRKKFGIRKDEIIVGTVGRLVPVKNQTLLIHAFGEVSKSCSTCKLVLVGDGLLKEELSLLAFSLGISDKVIFLGQRYDIPNILKVLDIFVLSSISEGMSNTILEAMSSGLPVIATHVGGNPEIVKNNETGILVASDNKEAMTSAIISMIEDPQKRKKMGRCGRKLAKDKFSLRAMVNNYETLYQKLYEKKVLFL